MFFDDAIDDKYNETYFNLYESLKSQYSADIHKGIIDLEKQLEDLYMHDGHDWLGRNNYRAASLAANIAACETLLHEFRDLINQIRE